MSEDAKAKLIRNERLRLAATLSNNIAVALIVTGAIAPGVAFVYGNPTLYSRFWPLYAIVFLAAGFLCHQFARIVLKGLMA